MTIGAHSVVPRRLKGSTQVTTILAILALLSLVGSGGFALSSEHWRTQAANDDDPLERLGNVDRQMGHIMLAYGLFVTGCIFAMAFVLVAVFG